MIEDTLIDEYDQNTQKYVTPEPSRLSANQSKRKRETSKKAKSKKNPKKRPANMFNTVGFSQAYFHLPHLPEPLAALGAAVAAIFN